MQNEEIVGLIPAGGRASRLGLLPCSKEIFPVGFEGERPKAISAYLLDKYQQAGANKVYFILRPGKWDIPAFYGDGADMEMDFAYLMLRHLYGVPYTLDQAYPFIRQARVLLGFPDMLYGPDDVYAQLLQKQEESQADLVLGLYRVENAYEASKSDMVDFDAQGQILDIQIKPAETDRRFSWINAVWGPRFTEFLHTFIAKDLEWRMAHPEAPEIHISRLVMEAIKADLSVYGMPFDESFLDVGTLPSLKKGWKRFV